MLIPKNKPEKIDFNDLEFDQGVIYYDLTISDTIIQSFIDSMIFNSTYVKDNTYRQSSDSLYVREFIANNPNFWKNYGLFPYMKNQVYLAGYEAVYLGESLTYKVQNKYNDLLQTGYIYLASKVGLKSSVNLIYQENNPVLQQVQLPIYLSFYTKDYTQDTDTLKIANYTVQRASYTLKDSLDNPPGYLPWKVTIYSSDLFYASLNRVLPFYVDQKSGILRIDITFNKQDSYFFTLQANSIVRREILPQEYQSLQGSMIYDYNNPEQLKNFKNQLVLIKELPKIK
ncbi:hypothetical protein ACYSNV_10375 [Myroides sp. LJL119]